MPDPNHTSNPQTTGSPIPLATLPHQGTAFYHSQPDSNPTPYLPHQTPSSTQVFTPSAAAQHSAQEFPYTTLAASQSPQPQTHLEPQLQNPSNSILDNEVVTSNGEEVSGGTERELPHQAPQKGYEQVKESRQFPDGQGEYMGHVGNGQAPLEGVLLEKERKRQREAARGAGCCRCVVM